LLQNKWRGSQIPVSFDKAQNEEMTNIVNMWCLLNKKLADKKIKQFDLQIQQKNTRCD